jgi:16S rRNA G966 N2-methylase RsmD
VGTCVKYMGSKRSLLANGLGDLIRDRARAKSRVVDLFAGTALISWFAAEVIGSKVLAVDLQEFSKILAEAVVSRTRPLEAGVLSRYWLLHAERCRNRSLAWKEARFWQGREISKRLVAEARLLCTTQQGVGPVWDSYGGYYFSPAQALTLDYLRRHLPESREARAVCLSALIISATRCVAAPGHTAQPFQPTKTALPYIESAWRRDPLFICHDVLPMIARRHARRKGEAVVGDALDVAQSLNSKDLVIVDPPYSSAQYSRYYHVLETLARGACGPVFGTGRYPPIAERPQSEFSRRTGAKKAFEVLVATLSERGCEAILTFPQHAGSNGLIGEELVEIARRWFEVDVSWSATRFSTLGGNGRVRASRRRSGELIVSMSPRTT